MEENLLYLSIKYDGQFDRIYKAIQTKERIDYHQLSIWKKEISCSYTTIMSPDYPEGLKKITCPPFVLFYYGDLSLLNENTIGVIGMRAPSEYGKQVTEDISADLADNDFVIISGIALGVDTIAHNTSIKNGGKTIAVLGCGIDYCYPTQNYSLYEELKNNHLVISEYPGTLAPSKWMFPARNRLIAGLSDSIVVTEAKENSGTMITVGFALENGKEVMAVPSNVNGAQGCNTLIKQGAELVRDIDDILEHLKCNTFNI